MKPLRIKFMRNWQNLQIENIDGELWKPVKGYEGIYDASNKGRIWVIKSMRILKQHKRGGYLSCTIFDANKKSLYAKSHRVIAFAWVKNPKNKPCINHIDFDRENNEPDNLQWATHQENTDHMKLHNRTLKGKDNPAAILTEKQVIKIKADRSKVKDIAEKYGVSIPTIEAIRYGRTWKHLLSSSKHDL